MNRLSALNLQFAATKNAEGKKKKKRKPAVTNVWEAMDMDRFLTPNGIERRKATSKMMKSIAKDLNPYIESTEFPEWLVDKIRSVGINGLMIKG